MKLVMMSDTHYISRRSCTPDVAQTTLDDIAVTEQAMKQAAAENCGTIIITGDLTDVGDRYSHEEFAAILRDIKRSGKNVYVIFATHDYHHQKAYVKKFDDNKRRYTSYPWDAPYFDPDDFDYYSILTEEAKKELGRENAKPELVEALSHNEIWELYHEFGPEQAISVYEQDFCYCVDIDENTRCLMLNDIFRNVECADISASFSPECFRWIKKCVEEAKRDGKFIFACSHHPFMPTVPAHRLGASQKNLRTPYTGKVLADLGVELVFVGHTHASSTGFMRSDKGNLLCSVMTPSVRFYPPEYRLVEIDGENKTVKYSMRAVDTPAAVNTDGESLTEYYRRRMREEYYNSICGKDTFISNKLKTLTVGNIYFLFKNTAKLTKDEYEKVRDKLFFDFIMDLAFNMLDGNRDEDAFTAEYKLGNGISAVLESLIDAQPFVDIRNSKLGGYTVFEIFGKMLYDGSVPNNEAEFDFTKEPAEPVLPERPVSHIGGYLMALLFVLAVIFSPLLPIAAIVYFAVKLVKKRKQVKASPPQPLLKY